MQVVVMRVRDQHEVDGRQIMRPDAWMAHPLHRPMPERPVGVDGDVHAMDLRKETCVAQPSHRDLIPRGNRQQAKILTRLAWGKKRGDEHFVEELYVALAPAFGRQQADAVPLSLSAFQEATPFQRAGVSSRARS